MHACVESRLPWFPRTFQRVSSRAREHPERRLHKACWTVLHCFVRPGTGLLRGELAREEGLPKSCVGDVSVHKSAGAARIVGVGCLFLVAIMFCGESCSSEETKTVRRQINAVCGRHVLRVLPFLPGGLKSFAPPDDVDEQLTKIERPLLLLYGQACVRPNEQAARPVYCVVLFYVCLFLQAGRFFFTQIFDELKLLWVW